MRTLVIVTMTFLLAACAAPEAARGDRAAAAQPSLEAASRETVGAVRAPTVLGDVPIQDTSPETLEQLRSEPPQRLTIDSLGIDMPVVDVGLADNGTMEIPTAAADAGWYRFGPAPGSPSGNAVIAAHVDDRYGVGPFAQLKNLSAGDAIGITTASGEDLDFTVARVEQTSKQEVDMSLVFDRDAAPTLVLVTCGGRFDWDDGHYEDNVVVFATPVNRTSP
ncbi:class F sortase [uncultured Demequina sp.]|uniref:class F sortase n=1 Tax=uncultured Demequina sp. TaxID=693499 RepID=UPI0025EE2016|nr:class F sortase [uncultured Demequina sp.]